MADREVNNIKKQFDELVAEYDSTISSQGHLSFRHPRLKDISRDFLSQLKECCEEIRRESHVVRDEIVWDHLVVGFFGETNAGKSTLIETLRLMYDDGARDWPHGEIVGDGQSDFTKDASEYSLNINGLHVTLVDIPGIEGDESKYAGIIRKALRRVHYIIYVHPDAQTPNEKIAAKISDYLSDWTRVISVYNVRGAVTNYDTEEDRRELLTGPVIEQGRKHEEKFRRILGDLYWGNVTVQGLLAMLSCSNFDGHPKFSKDVKKMHKFFSSSDKALEFSNFTALTDIIVKGCGEFRKIIIDSQRHKLNALKKHNALRIENKKKEHLAQLSLLSSSLSTLATDIQGYFDNAAAKLSQGARNIVSRIFTSATSRISEMIDSATDSNDLKKKIDRYVSQLGPRVEKSIREHIDKVICELNSNVTGRVKDLRLRLELSVEVSPRRFSTEIDSSDISSHLDINLDDIGEVLATAAAGASIGLCFPGIGTLVGAGAGLILGIAKKAVTGDGGKGKAKDSLRHELSVIRDEALKEVESSLRTVKADLSSESHTILNKIRKERLEIDRLIAGIDELIHL